MLRGKAPEHVQKRLKMFMFGPAGVGKTTAAVQFPKSYIIDSERGAENYGKLVSASQSVVYQSTDINDVIDEVKQLLTQRHEFRTLIIDPITTLYNDLLEKCELKVGADFGRHYGAANKEMKRLANLIMALDMNVIVTAHAKTEYGENLRKLGYTFDGWRQLDYWFDLVVELTKKGKKRFGKVVKTRIETFPDDDVFEWSYDAMRERYDAATLERDANVVDLASQEQVREIQALINVVRLPEGTVDKWFAKANVDQWEDMSADAITKCIEYVKARFPSVNGNGHKAPEAQPRQRITEPTNDIDAGFSDAFENDVREAFTHPQWKGKNVKKFCADFLAEKKVERLTDLGPIEREEFMAAVVNGPAKAKNKVTA